MLALLGAVEEDTAQNVLNRFDTAQAVRDPRARLVLGGIPVTRWRERRLPPPGLPEGDVRVVPIGTTTAGGRDGEVLHLLTVAVAPGRGVAVTVAGRITADRRPRRDQVPMGPYGPYREPDLGLAFTADGQHHHPGRIEGGGTCDGTWWCLEVLLPAAAAGLRRLNITAADGSDAARVEVTAGVGGVAGPAEVRMAEGNAEQVLYALAASLLWFALWPAPDHQRPAQIAAMAAAVQGAGLVPAVSPALRRYAALAGQLESGGGPAGEDLPVAWAGALAGRGVRDGPERVYSATAVLPVLDGAQFAVTGLVSTAESATLRLLAWGWAPGEAPGLAPPFVWSARDDAGRWHVGRPHWHSVTRQAVVLDVTLLPPLHPAATVLEVIVTGPGGRARATVPLPGS